MKNPLRLTILHLPGAVPKISLLPASAFSERVCFAGELTAIREQANQEAEKIVHQAEQLLADTYQERERILNETQQESQQICQQAKAVAITEAVQWLCDTHEIEQRIASELAGRWRQLTAKILQELLGEYDTDSRLLDKIEQKLAVLLPAKQILLFVAPASRQQVYQHFQERKDICIQSDPDLKAGQACLDNGLLRIYLDIPLHQSLLLEQLSGGQLEKEYG